MQTSLPSFTTDTKYRPDIDRARAAWVAQQFSASFMERIEYSIGFDEWLEAHDREQRAIGWEEGFMDRGPLTYMRDVPDRSSIHHRYQEVGGVKS